MKKIYLIYIFLFLMILSSCGENGTTPTTEFFFSEYNEFIATLNNIRILEPELTENQIILKYPDYNEENGKIFIYYRHYIYADILNADEKITNVNYKIEVQEDHVRIDDINGAQVLRFIYQIEDENLKGIVLSFEPVSENHIEDSNYEFVEIESSIATVIFRDKAVPGYEPSSFIEDLNIDSYIEDGNIIHPSYEVRYAINESTLSKQNIRISYFYKSNYARIESDFLFEQKIITYINQHLNLLILQ